MCVCVGVCVIHVRQRVEGDKNVRQRNDIQILAEHIQTMV